MEFEFNKELMALNSVEIENIGCFAIEASNDEGMFYYMLARTTLGVTSIATWGPVVPDVELITNGYGFCYTKMDYKEKDVAKFISKYINDRNKGITHIETISIEDAIEQVKDMKEYLRNYNQELN